MPIMGRAACVLAVACAAGCYASHASEIDPSPPDQLDLLLVIDTSSSMGAEQASFARELPALLSALATGDLDGDGRTDTRAYASIHVGVITTDMGSGGYLVPTCARSDLGDDGVLRSGGCAGADPAFLQWSSAEELGAFTMRAACAAEAGLTGCDLEQQLEAVLKALTPLRPQPWTHPDFEPLAFFGGSIPHGSGANADFIRDDSLLAIVILTDEEDCSARDPDLFDPGSVPYAGDLNVRCFVHGARALHPIERYTRGLLQLRRDPSRLAFFVIAGVPPDLEPGAGEAIPWVRLLSDDPTERDPRMVPRIDPDLPFQTAPSCDDPARGIAMPPVRILQVGRELERAGARVSVASICRERYTSAMAGFVLRLTE